MLKNIKLERLNSLILREITIILTREYSNSKVMSNIVVHEVKTTNDFSVSKIYYSLVYNIDEYTSQEIQQLVERQVKNIRYKLAQKLTIFKTPKLVFVYDKSLENANKIENILHNVNPKVTETK